MAELQVPSLVLIAAATDSCPRKWDTTTQALLPNCQVVLIHDAGHVISVDRPEALAAVVEDFVADPESFLATQESGRLYR